MAKEQKNELSLESEKTVETPVERTVRIVLPYEANKGDQFVGINGRTWLIKRGVEVEVPECVYEVLKERDRAVMKAHEIAERFMTN